jgi:predicted DNA-binding transcriptional regulator AlpA
MTDHYLSTTEVAARLGITRAAVSKYRLPPPDALIGAVRGWLPETIDQWQAARPGQGARTDRPC